MEEEYSDDDFKMCPRCGCCEMFWEVCEQCGGDGVFGHECGEDTCCCKYPEDNVECDTCEGEGGFWHCDCDEFGIHQKSVIQVRVK